MAVINLFGGPGSGKSTIASGLFFEMKCHQMDVELINEYAKKLTWQHRHNTLKDQFKVTAEQNHKMEILKEQVEWTITDSPIILGIYYAPNYFPNTFPPFVIDVFNSYDNFNFWINRIDRYDPKGRNQSKQEALDADQGIREILNTHNIAYTEIMSSEQAPKEIFDIIKGLKHGPC